MVLNLDFYLVQPLNKINETLSTNGNEQLLNLIVPTITAIVSVILGAFVGSYISSIGENKKQKIEFHKAFLIDINKFFVKIHEIYQNIIRYNQLLYTLEEAELVFDLEKSYKENIAVLSRAREESARRLATITQVDQQNKIQYWGKVNEISKNLLDFDLIIKLAQTLNESAFVNSLFIDKEIKKEFDILINKAQEISQNGLDTFFIHEFRLDVIKLIADTKNKIDSSSNDLFTEMIKEKGINKIDVGTIVKIVGTKKEIRIKRIGKNNNKKLFRTKLDEGEFLFEYVNKKDRYRAMKKIIGISEIEK